MSTPISPSDRTLRSGPSTALGRVIGSAPDLNNAPYGILLAMARNVNLVIDCALNLKQDTPANQELVRSLLRDQPVTPLGQDLATTPYRKFTVVQLKKQVRERGLSARGARHKADFVKILFNANKNQPFRFLDLPPEIRLIINQMVLGETMKLTPTREAPELITPPAMLQINNKLLREEASAVYYNLNKFTIMLTSSNGRAGGLCADSKRWLEAIGKESMNMLNRISFEIRRVHRFLILNVEFSKKKTEEHLTVNRTCFWHDIGTSHCSRWIQPRKLDDLAMSEEDKAENLKTLDKIKEMSESMSSGTVSLEEFEQCATDIGSMLMRLRTHIK